MLGDDYEPVTTNQLFAYKIVQVFKGKDDLTAGHEIPVLALADADEGIRRIGDDDNDFLAYLYPGSESCRSFLREHNSSFYYVNGCVNNRKWSSLTDAELSFLGANKDILVKKDLDANCPVCHFPWWRVFRRLYCLFRKDNPYEI